MREPTQEQKSVIEDTSRIRLVRAAPGSGKTWLVGEVMRKEIEHWSSNGGIAALSFTRVGGNEIRKAVGYELDCPHFVGTIDSFLFRYVVRPFLQKVFPSLASPRLIPAAWEPQYWTKNPEKQSWMVTTKNNCLGYSLFKISYQGLLKKIPILVIPNSFKGGYRVIPDIDSSYVWEKKKESWKKYGWITHADTALLSYWILSHPQHGKLVCEQLAARFPFIIIDELQDTGFFLGKALLRILDVSIFRGLLVGDPDQAIYEFNGAKPELFDAFSGINGATELSLGKSQRCPPAVILAARFLQSTRHEIQPNPEKEGLCLLLIYKDMIPDTQKVLVCLAKEYPRKIIKSLVRSNSNALQIKSARHIKEFGKLRCPALLHISRAVRSFRNGDNVKALAQINSCISLWLFQYEGIDENALIKKGIQPDLWKQLLIDCLLSCAKIDTSVTYEQWQKEAGSIIGDCLQHSKEISPIFEKVKILAPHIKNNRKKNEADTQMSLFLPSFTQNGPPIPIQTVHAVKGETHDITVFVCPSEGKNVKCPAEVWWSADVKDQEERRIAYVAFTRAQGDMMLLVSQNTANALKIQQNEFCKCFNVMSVEKYCALKEDRLY